MTGDERHRMEVIFEYMSRLQIASHDFCKWLYMNGKFDLLLESHAALDQKIDRVQVTSQNQHIEAMSMIKIMHDSLDTKVDSLCYELKEDIRVVGEKVGGHEGRIVRLEKQAA